MKILLIKLGAMGDVLRTTPILTALRRKFPQGRISWLVDPASAEVLEENPLVHRLLRYSGETLARLKSERFDLLINLDKENEALEAAMSVASKKKMGFGRATDGNLSPLDALSDYAYRLGIDDELKFKKNKKTYQEISFEQAGLRFGGEEYIFMLDKGSMARAHAYLEKLGAPVSRVPRPVIGLNTGSGSRFAGKRLPIGTYLDLVEKFSADLGATVFLLGGKDEIERNLEIEQRSKRRVINTGSHPIREFAVIVQGCDLVISGDTTAMHIAIAVKTPVVAYFGSTCGAEIELYGRGKKLLSDIACSPCYKRICPIDEQCMKDMRTDQILGAAREVLEGSPSLQRL